MRRPLQESWTENIGRLLVRLRGEPADKSQASGFLQFSSVSEPSQSCLINGPLGGRDDWNCQVASGHDQNLCSLSFHSNGLLDRARSCSRGLHLEGISSVEIGQYRDQLYSVFLQSVLEKE